MRLANAGPFGDLQQLQAATGRSILAWLVQGNAAFLALSEQSRDELRAFGCPSGRIRPMTNGVDTQRFHPLTDSPPADSARAENLPAEHSPAKNPPSENREQRARTVLFVGRLAAQKNPELLLHAWEQLSGQGDYRLLIAGEGPLRESLQRQISSRGLGNVQLLGACQSVEQLYHQASVFVLPSRSEGCSNALLEAMACGLCPVVSNIGGNRDVVSDHVNGRLVEPDDVQQLSGVLAEVLRDHGLRRRLARGAREHVVSCHEIHDVADRYLHEFVQLVS